ncbi:cellulase family glycosylhydrolase [Algoriphagus sp. D3-2-R+10]|uniref:cellulase family glycosylhydrolase n=1 Tax=Algoriphagus aurantiacus TaxID=3103948 RepID=UPI002B3756B0|nr:cellulase family glycosylhydrolase [Algoriphagus sp. D3-2-R+10]MEB2775361.1 cellulase family glycosylhydrolase [Algoriphagus sp. D3-2-R+10]
MKSTRILAMIFGIMALVSCGEEGGIDPVLDVSVSKTDFESEGGEVGITITSNSEWSISNPASSWLQLSQVAGSSGSTSVQITALVNATGLTRSTQLNVIAPNGQARRISVSQISSLYPSYNTSPLPPNATGMGSNAVELAAKLKLGWNIGNTMEAPGSEEGWGNPRITEEFVKFVKQQGFNAIRLPVSWDWHHVMDRKTAQIDPAWLDRVKEVVGYCVDNDVYVLLNIHWDGGWLDQNINKDMQDSVNAKQKAYWEQIATALRDFDEHLLFAGTNEPPAEDAEQMGILNTFHQTFMDAVRSTGGRNSYRVLVIQGPSTDIEKTNDLMNKLPTDEVEDRMMAEIHYYTPSQFCLLMDGDASWGKMFYYWGEGYHSTIEPDRNATWGEEDDVVRLFGKMKTKFVDNGIPVIFGEYGAYRRDNNQHVPLDLETHNNSVDHWITYVTKQAIANGMIPFWWDTGGALDRRNYTVKDQRTIDALIEGGK